MAGIRKVRRTSVTDSTTLVAVTGASGRVGSLVAQGLADSGIRFRALLSPTRIAEEVQFAERAPFSFTEESTWGPAFDEVERLFVMRPPQISNVRRDMIPALEAARAAGVRRAVLLSVQGADRNPAVPHHALESWLRTSGLEWTFVRAGFFMQNLSTTHAADIRDRDLIMVPAGRGRTAFVDTRDVAAVALAALIDDGHSGAAYTPTGSAALTYFEVAEILSSVLARPIRYANPGLLRYLREVRRQGMSMGMAAVTAGIYTIARMGMAGRVTGDVERVTGRRPISLRSFAQDEAGAWSRPIAVAAISR